MRLTIGKKLKLSYICLSFIVIIAGLTGIFMVNKVASSGDVVIKEKLPYKDAAMRAIFSAEQALNTCRKFLLANTNLNKIENEIIEYISNLDMFISMIKFGTESSAFKNSKASKIYVKDGLALKVAKGTDAMQSLIKGLSIYLKEFDKNALKLILLHKQRVQYSFDYDNVNYELPGFLYAVDIQHRNWFKALKESVEYEMDLIVNTDPSKSFFGKWYKKFKINDKKLNLLLKDFNTINTKFYNLGKNSLESSDQEKKESFLDQAVTTSANLEEKLEKLLKYSKSKIKEVEIKEEDCINLMLISSAKIKKALNTLNNVANNDLNLAIKNANYEKYKAKQSSLWFMSILVIASIVLALFLGIFITRSITKPLNKVITGISESSGQVLSASIQFSESSQHLSAISSEQAATFEETTSSLEEMSAMSKKNAENADQTNSLMVNTNSVVENANDSMNQLTISMDNINKASENTSNIVKTIDEIAFQTNLLALNAAVEAARAGEAGAGFAVVADEVRNLALRASEASKNTATLIEKTIKQIKNGSTLLKSTNENFNNVTKSSNKVVNLVSEINTASKEQSEGVEQINKAITEMDKVTQQNAANAQELSSAAEEMNLQADKMIVFVEELSQLVGRKFNKIQGEAKSTKGLKKINQNDSREVRPDKFLPY